LGQAKNEHRVKFKIKKITISLIENLSFDISKNLGYNTINFSKFSDSLLCYDESTQKQKLLKTRIAKTKKDSEQPHPKKMFRR
jgi:hypothetical protein